MTAHPVGLCAKCGPKLYVTTCNRRRHPGGGGVISRGYSGGTQGSTLVPRPACVPTPTPTPTAIGSLGVNRVLEDGHRGEVLSFPQILRRRGGRPPQSEGEAPRSEGADRGAIGSEQHQHHGQSSRHCYRARLPSRVTRGLHPTRYYGNWLHTHRTGIAPFPSNVTRERTWKATPCCTPFL